MILTIKHLSGSDLFTHDCENNTLRLTAEAARNQGANLEGANLEGANLEGANLEGANLRGANLRGANLRGAYLEGANLEGANLRGAYLRAANLRGAYLRAANLRGAYLEGAYLRGANLEGANLEGAYLRGANLRGAYLDEEKKLKLVGDRPVLIIGPIGSRNDYLTTYVTCAGIYLRAGCFFGTLEQFKAKLKETHADNNHGKEYQAALALVAMHAKLWGGKGGAK